MTKSKPFIDTQFFNRCILTLTKAHSLLIQAEPESIDHDLYRSACVKEFEIIVEQAGKLLKKALKLYFASTKAVDKLVFKDIFRYAAKHDLMDKPQAERWLIYRDNRNTTAHDYGVKFAEHTLKLLPDFIADAAALELTLRGLTDDWTDHNRAQHHSKHCSRKL